MGKQEFAFQIVCMCHRINNFCVASLYFISLLCVCESYIFIHENYGSQDDSDFWGIVYFSVCWRKKKKHWTLNN